MNGEEQAYPNPPVYWDREKVDKGRKGFTKREVFAMAAMQGILSNPARAQLGAHVAKDALLYADELLKELENGK